MSTQSACGNEQRFAFHGFHYDEGIDMPQVELLDCLYGNGLGAHTQKEVDAAQGRRGECGNMAGDMPIGDDLAAAAAKESTRHSGQGEMQQYLLNMEGSSIAMKQEQLPIREFSVADALAKRPAEHWREAVVLNQEAQQEIHQDRGGQGVAVAGHNPPEREARAMA